MVSVVYIEIKLRTTILYCYEWPLKRKLIVLKLWLVFSANTANFYLVFICRLRYVFLGLQNRCLHIMVQSVVQSQMSGAISHDQGNMRLQNVTYIAEFIG